MLRGARDLASALCLLALTGCAGTGCAGASPTGPLDAAPGPDAPADASPDAPADASPDAHAITDALTDANTDADSVTDAPTDTDALTDASADASADAALDALTDTNTDADSVTDALADAAPDTSADAGPSSWGAPTCTSVAGPPAVTFTSDEGATLAPTSQQLTGTHYTMGLAALPRPGTLVAVRDAKVLRSQDAGCSWQPIGTLEAGSWRAVAGPDDRAWLWADNQPLLARVDGDIVTPCDTKLSKVLGLGADPAHPDRARYGSGGGQLFETTDAGATFEPVGVPASAAGLDYRVAFDAADLDHAVYGRAVEGFFSTFDGGATWHQASFVPAPVGNVNGFQVVISPADGQVVWAMALDIGAADAGAADGGRHIYRSGDGGLTFAPVVDQGPDVTLTNGPLLVAHPTDASVLYFVFGTYFQGYGTDLFRYAHDGETGGGALTKTHSGYDELGAMAFAPGAPAWMYVGLVSEAISLGP